MFKDEQKFFWAVRLLFLAGGLFTAVTINASIAGRIASGAFVVVWSWVTIMVVRRLIRELQL